MSPWRGSGKHDCTILLKLLEHFNGILDVGKRVVMAFKLHSGKAALRQGHVEAKAVAQWVDMQSLNGVSSVTRTSPY